MSIREWFKDFATSQYKSHQLALVDNILDKFWSWQVTGYGNNSLVDSKKIYLMGMLDYLDLPNDATALDVGISEVIRVRYPETGVEKMIGFSELEIHARKLADDLGRPRYIHYEFNDGQLHKYCSFGDGRYEISP